VTTARTLYSSGRAASSRPRPVSLVDLIDRVLAGGVVVHGHVTLAVADVNLIELDIALIVAATATLAER
jgi:Gas vesicle protein